jgi:hypothetical protein
MLYLAIWCLFGFLSGVWMVWSSGDDIDIGDVFFVAFFTAFGPIPAVVIVAMIIKETEFWNITLYRRKRT